MFQIYRKLYGLFDRHERARALIMMILMLSIAVSEVVGVASIMPFIAVLANPGVVQTNPYLRTMYEWLEFESVDSFLFFLGVAFFGLLVGTLALRAIGSWAQLRFAQNRNYSWSLRLVGGYLRQPYEWYLNRHSADLSTSILAEVNQVVTGALLPAMQALAQSLVASLLLILLLVIDPKLAVAMGLVLGASYYAMSVVMKRRLKRIGIERRKANRERFHVVQEAFGGIKDVKIAGLEEVFLRRFRRPAQVLADRQVAAGLIWQLPTYLLQAILFGGMLGVLLYLMARHGGFQEALPAVALYAFAGYRLMPAVQKIYEEVSKFRFAEAALDALAGDFADLPGIRQQPKNRMHAGKRVSLGLSERLELQGLTYRYPNASRAALRNLSLCVEAFTTVGLVGSTGSGKTTVVDLILGLLSPQTGSITVDGQVITGENLSSWQRSLGYVPQQIFLADDTVAANIAFGIPAGEVDLAAVERASRVANLHDFVMTELPHGYQTPIGERGVRLSGGQRQRIGIARALYHDPDVLILDEATSALDNLTEQAVMGAVDTLGSGKTIILIAHRLSTVRRCDAIYLLEHGQVVSVGTYDELIGTSEGFRRLAEGA